MNRRHPRWLSREGTAAARPRRRAQVAAVATAVLLAGLPLAAPAGAAHGSTESRGIEIVCPPGEITSAGFTDVADEGADQRAAIDCVAAHGVARGTTATTYNPGGTVTRGQMASFVMRTLDRVGGYERPLDAPDAFSDDDGSTHEAAINDAAAEGIVQGLADGSYGAGAVVTRAQMASFVTRTLGVAGVPVSTGAPDAFSDDDGNTHEAAINALAQSHVVGGTAEGVYSPAASVTRRQMALFLARSLDLLAEKGLVAPPPSRSAPTNVVATAKGATTVNVRWSAPATGTPDGYDIHRRTVATPTTACPTSGYTKVGAVTSPLRQLDDAGLVVDTTYCYRIAARSGTGSTATTSDLSLPSDAARATTSNTPKMKEGVADTTAETITVTYDQPVTCTDASRRQFAYGGSTSTAPTKAACSVSGSTTLVLTFANVARDGDLTYTQDVDPAVRVKSATGKPALTPQTIAVVDPPPSILSAEADTTNKKVTVTYSELVSCIADTMPLFSFQAGTGTPVKPNGITGCLTSRSTTVVLTFEGGIAAPGALTYTEGSVAERRITDAGGKTAPSPKSVADKPPAMVKALATLVPHATDRDPSAGTTSVLVTYDQAVTCPATAAPQFTYAGAAGFATMAAGCSGSTLTLTFPGAAGEGTLTYTPAPAPNEANRIKDAANVVAGSPQQVAVDAMPFMRFGVDAATTTTAPRLTVTYSEPVTCIDATKALFTFTGAGTSTDGNRTPKTASCSGNSLVLTFAAPYLTDDQPTPGDLTYAVGTNTSLRVKDATGNEAVAQTIPVVARPFMRSAVLAADFKSLTVTYSEPVTCGTDSKAQFRFGGASPTEVVCSDATAVLKFPGLAADPVSDLAYAADTVATLRVKDATGNEAVTPQTLDVRPPQFDQTKPLVVTRGTGTAGTVIVDYTEAIRCTGITLASFSYTGANGSPSGGTCSGTKLTLTFSNLPASTSSNDALKGDLRLVAGQSGGITDLTGNAAKSGDTKRTIPSMSTAALTTATTITVTYSEPVTCTSGPGPASRFTYTPPAPPAVPPTTVTCNSTATVVLTFDSPVVAGGSLKYVQGDSAVKDVDFNEAQDAQTVAQVSVV